MNKRIDTCVGTKMVGKRIAHLLRVKHYIKNILVFFPMIFSGNLLNVKIFQENILGFAAFSALACYKKDTAFGCWNNNLVSGVFAGYCFGIINCLN